MGCGAGWWGGTGGLVEGGTTLVGGDTWLVGCGSGYWGGAAALVGGGATCPGCGTEMDAAGTACPGAGVVPIDGGLEWLEAVRGAAETEVGCLGEGAGLTDEGAD